jgi:hypothetical protein
LRQTCHSVCAKSSKIVPWGREAFNLPKTFLRLGTKFQTADSPMTLAKWFFENSLVDSKGLEFYHHHWEFLRVLGQNPPPSAMSKTPNVYMGIGSFLLLFP